MKKKEKVYFSLGREDYDIYLQEAGSPLFLSRRWLSLFDKSNFYYYGLRAKNGTELAGAWLLPRRYILGLRIITHPPLTPYLGIVTSRLSRHIIQSLLESILAMRPDYLYFAFHPLQHNLDLMPFRLHGIHIEVRYTYLLELDRSECELWKGLDGARRRNLRRAQKDGLKVRVASVEDVPIMLSLIQQTFQRQGIKTAWLPLAERIMRVSTSEKWGQGWLVYHQGRAISTVFIVWDHHAAYYLLGGYDHTRHHNSAGSLGMWTAILFAKAQGLRWFDFEGSEIPNIERYFRKFGGKQTAYYVVRYMSPRFQFLHAIRQCRKERCTL